MISPSDAALYPSPAGYTNLYPSYAASGTTIALPHFLTGPPYNRQLACFHVLTISLFVV